MKNKLQTNKKFFKNNLNIFLRYFKDLETYNALISAGNFNKMREIIKQEGGWTCDESIAYIQSIFN